MAALRRPSLSCRRCPGEEKPCLAACELHVWSEQFRAGITAEAWQGMSFVQRLLRRQQICRPALGRFMLQPSGENDSAELAT